MIFPPRPAGARRLTSRALAAAAAALLGGCAVTGPPPGHEMLNAVLWQRDAAEYRAVAVQAYRLAAARLAEGLADPAWTAALEQEGDVSGLPPAVMLDIDETVLDNTPYEARIIRAYGAYSRATFAAWCEEAAAGPVPGVTEFLARARSLEVAVYFYTARREALRSCTLRNLARLGLPVAPDGSNLLMGGTAKTAWRSHVAATHRIVLLIGDNLEDFVTGSRQDPAARRAVMKRHRDRWGRQWIVLPNPMYGHWESAFYGFDHGLSREAKTGHKLEALEPGHGK